MRLQPRLPAVSWAASNKRGQQVEGGDSAALLSCALPRETSHGVLRPALNPSAEEGHATVGAGPEEGHKNYFKSGAPLL